MPSLGLGDFLSERPSDLLTSLGKPAKMPAMRLTDFDYDLPPELIAKTPLPERSASRLLCLEGNSGALTDRRFRDLLELLRPGDLLVLNDTRVIPARLSGHKASGGRVELLVERLVGDRQAVVHLRASKSPKPGIKMNLEGNAVATVTGREGDLFCLTFDEPVAELLERAGHTPLPPYLNRSDTLADRERYQTVFARQAGAVAAPTAGLHFDAALLAALEQRGIQRAHVTLHVGAGTFQPVRVDEVEAHVMHAEYLDVSETVCEAVRQTRERGGRVVAVGTTAVRALETAAASGQLKPYQGETRLFVYPGYRFHVVDAMITNFHLPRSTLLMLVCAFAGREHVLRGYAHAVAESYRFFSYGDAMFITSGSQGADHEI